MRLLYLDESGQAGRPDLFAVGGFCVEDREWRELADRWRAVLARHAADRLGEIKWAHLRRGRVPWTVGDDLYRMLGAAPVTAFVTVFDGARGPALEPAWFATPDAVYANAVMLVLERFHRYLEEVDDVGLVVVDERDPAKDRILRDTFDRFVAEGSPYVTFSRLVEGVLLEPSDRSIGLQIADQVVGATVAADRRIPDGLRCLRWLTPSLATHPVHGGFEGVGLKRFPDAPRQNAAPRLFEGG